MSPALSPEAERRSVERLLTRIASEVTERDGHLIWPPESYYHLLPMEHRIEVGRRVRRNLEALAEYGL